MDTPSKFLFPVMIFLNFLSFNTYGIPAAFYPNMASSKGSSAFLTGLVFAMFPIGGLFSGLYIGKKMYHFNKKHILISTQILLALSFTFFGLTYLMENLTLFIAMGIFARILQGLAIGAFQTTLYSLAPQLWPKSIEQKIALLEIIAGLGIGLGPIIGSIFYSLVDYKSIYILPSCLLLVSAIFVTPKIFPNIYSEEIKSSKSLSLVKVYFNKEMMFNFLVMTFSYSSLIYIMTGFENRIIDLGGSAQLSSVIYSLSQVGYIIGSVYLILKKVEYLKMIFMFALLIGAISNYLISLENFWVIGTGLLFLGFSNALILIPNISQNILILEKIFPDNEEQLINDMSSAIFLVGISFAEFLGPILQGIFLDLYGFEESLWICGGFLFVLCSVFSMFGGGLISLKNFIYREKKKKEEKEALLTSFITSKMIEN